MKEEKVVEILALIDRSGSMSNIISEAVGAFNAFIEEQKKADNDDTVIVTLASFDNNYETVFDRVLLEKVPELTVDMVSPRGMTALNDAIGKLVTSAPHPDRPTILLIQTDGFENASEEYSTEGIKALIEQKEKDGWDVNFIGAGLSDIDVKQMAAMRGFSLDKTIAVAKSSTGMSDMADYYASVTSTFRSSNK